MIMQATPLPGVTLLRATPQADARGFFARLWCADSFAGAGLDFVPRQVSVSFSTAAGTLRGLHWQAPPHAETKLVWPVRGRVFDVAVDLRTRRWFGVELDADAPQGLLIPPGFAHGLLTLTDAAEVLYFIDTPYAPAAAQGARYDDPAFAIAWPGEPVVVSERDRAWPDFGLDRA